MPTEKLHFQYKIKRYFSKKCSFPTCWQSSSNGLMISFSFSTVGPMLDLFILKHWAIAAAYPNLQHLLSNSTFSCNVRTFLCFLGTLSASSVILHMGPLVLLKIYSIALNTVKNSWVPQEIIFYCHMHFTREVIVHREMISIAWHFKQVFITLACVLSCFSCVRIGVTLLDTTERLNWTELNCGL